jgi:hypothetical protein
VLFLVSLFGLCVALLCRIIIILNMEIVGNPKLLGAGPKQQAAGPVSNPQHQQQQQ